MKTACSNGHRYDQVWLGSRYGWVCFDATPTLPDDLFKPRLEPDWEIVHLKSK